MHRGLVVTMLHQWRLLLKGHPLVGSSAAVRQLACSTQPAGWFGCAVHMPAQALAALRALSSQQALQQRTCQSCETKRTFSNSSSSSSTTAPEEQQVSVPQPASDASSNSQHKPEQLQLELQQAQPAPSSSTQQPLTAAYGPRRVTAKRKTAGVQKREGIVHVNSTMNNTIMVLTDREHKVQTWTSGGTIGYKNANKATPMAAELAAKELAKRAVNMGFHSVVVKLKGMGKNKQFAVQSLAANGLTVTQLWDVTPIPYNGCRLPRRRRV